jgi:hypothetical protein
LQDTMTFPHFSSRILRDMVARIIDLGYLVNYCLPWFIANIVFKFFFGCWSSSLLKYCQSFNVEKKMISNSLALTKSTSRWRNGSAHIPSYIWDKWKERIQIYIIGSPSLHVHFTLSRNRFF